MTNKVTHPYTQEISTELIDVKPIIGHISDAPEYHASLKYAMAKMYQRDIKRKEANADLAKWQQHMELNFGLAKWYYSQVNWEGMV